MKKLLLATALLIGMTGAAFAQTSSDLNNDGCVDQSEAIVAVVGATSPGTFVAYQTENILIFSNPNESSYFLTNFVDGCFATSDVIDQVAFDNIKTGI